MTVNAVVLQLMCDGWPTLVRAEHAALLGDDQVAVDGQQLAQDGTPLGHVWLRLDLRDLLGSVLGVARLPGEIDSGPGPVSSTG